MQDVSATKAFAAIIVIDSATHLLMISSPDIDKVPMSLYDITVTSVTWCTVKLCNWCRCNWISDLHLLCMVVADYSVLL